MSKNEQTNEKTGNDNSMPEQLSNLIDNTFLGCTKNKSKAWKDNYFNFEVCPRTDTILRITLHKILENTNIYVDCYKVNLFENNGTIIKKNIYSGIWDEKSINFVLTNYQNFIR